MKQALQHLRAPRYCSITHQPMFEGWVVADGVWYIKGQADAEKHAVDAGYNDLQDAFDNDYMYYTDWQDIPEDEWDDMPAGAIVASLIEEMQGLVDTIRTTKYMTEVSAPYQSILDSHREWLKEINK